MPGNKDPILAHPMNQLNDQLVISPNAWRRYKGTVDYQFWRFTTQKCSLFKVKSSPALVPLVLHNVWKTTYREWPGKGNNLMKL